MRLRWMYLTSGMLATLVLAAPLAAISAPSTTAPGQSTQRTIRLTLRDGTSRLVRLDGVGCNESICSRIAVNTRTIGSAMVNHTPFDDLAAVRDLGGAAALFVLKDGSTRRLSVVPENRVLYVIAADGGRQKVGLDRLVSIEFDVTP